MQFARYAFLLAGIYGLIIIPPMYFMEAQVNPKHPQIEHPEFYYGFVGVVIAWQVAFITIAFDPRRYQPIMLATWIEKFSFALATIVLFIGHRVDFLILIFGLIDLALGVLFVIAYLKTKQDQEQGWMIVPRERSGVTESTGPLI